MERSHTGGAAMPARLPRPCSHPGCPAVVPPDRRYCPDHERAERSRYDRERGSAAARGYDARWRRVRRMVLAEEPLCRRCAAAGRVMPATDVHHIDGDVRNLSRENLEPLCHECHSRETAASGRRWGRGM